MSNIEDTGVCELIDGLLEVTHLDLIQEILVSNEHADAHAPDLQLFLLKILSEERDRRDAGAEAADYTVVDFRELPMHHLLCMIGFVNGASELCSLTTPRIPTAISFFTLLQRMLLKCLSFKVLALESELASMRSQNGSDSASPPS